MKFSILFILLLAITPIYSMHPTQKREKSYEEKQQEWQKRRKYEEDIQAKLTPLLSTSLLFNEEKEHVPAYIQKTCEYPPESIDQLIDAILYDPQLFKWRPANQLCAMIDRPQGDIAIKKLLNVTFEKVLYPYSVYRLDGDRRDACPSLIKILYLKDLLTISKKYQKNAAAILNICFSALLEKKSELLDGLIYVMNGPHGRFSEGSWWGCCSRFDYSHIISGNKFCAKVFSDFSAEKLPYLKSFLDHTSHIHMLPKELFQELLHYIFKH